METEYVIRPYPTAKSHAVDNVYRTITLTMCGKEFFVFDKVLTDGKPIKEMPNMCHNCILGLSKGWFGR